ncbi:MAG: hypothetical protein BMS9Abin30_1166 [Gammaproteobacteria bacterium]|nr:MAG: hypothetical protein BMS9Abin30_1166 [Gammaproteobacteria bacterium]
MTHKNLITVLLLWSGLFLAPLVVAQAETAPAEEKANPGSQEVEYSEDNYRRFMELRNENLQKSSMLTNAYQPGTQKLDELPEASQKHLRNQLREIILEEGEWAPGDENKEYPYVPSEAAQSNPGLAQQEAEAWGELVGKYQQREAQIYANSSRLKSASGAEGGAPGASRAQANAGESAGSNSSNPGEAGDGDGDAQKQPGQQQQSASNARERAYSSSSASSSSPNDPDAVNTSGVSQSALEYLMTKNRTAEPGQLVVSSKDTLSIKDLQNVQGITISTGTGSSQATPIEIEADSERRRRKDEDG